MRAILWIGVGLMACGGTSPSAGEPAVAEVEKAAGQREDVDISTFISRHAGGIQVVDVRTQAEWDAGHVPGAIHVPLADLKAEHPKLASLRDGEPVYFICAAGGRSARAADQMAATGMHAVNVLGGTGAWVAAGKSTE